MLSIVLLTGCIQSVPRADLVIINGAEPESLDPAVFTGQPDGRVVGCLFAGLTRFDPRTAEPRPCLAERWQISPDQRRYIFHLRRNAVWSTGEPITAHDVVYSWRRIVNPATACDYAGLLFYVENGEAIATGKLRDLTRLGVRALDEYTLEVRLVAPTFFFLQLCAYGTLAVVPRQTIEQYGDRWLKARPLPVSGPYQLEYWRIRDRIRLRKNPRYWDAANTHLEVVDFLPIESPTAALNLYESGQADVIWDKNLIPSELVDALRDRPDYHTYDYLGTYFIRINVTKPPFDDVRVRQALALSIDKRRLVERITRAGEQPASSITPTCIAHYKPPQGLGYDPERARQLLAQAGYPDGRGFPVFHYLFNSGRINEQIGVELQDMWKTELGIQVELKQAEWKVYLAAQSALDYDLSRSSWIGDYNDPNTFLDLFMSNNGNNRTGWKNPKYDRLVREANAQTDATTRLRLLYQAETLLVREEVPIIPLFFYKGVTLYDPEKIDGIYFNALDEHPVEAIRRKAW